MPHSGSPVVTRLGGIGNRLLSPLPRADFDLLAPELETVALDQEAVVARAGDRVEHVFFPNSGALSQILGVRRTTVTLLMRNLRASGAIRSDRRGQIVVDRARLAVAACECHGNMRLEVEEIFSGTIPLDTTA